MNPKISTIVIDNDPIGRKALELLISRHPSLALLDEADNVRSAREKIYELRPDAIFLDFHMPDATGIDLLRSLDFQPFVVFVTFSKSHALPAIDFQPVDYVLKPVSPERFAATVARLEERVYATRALALVSETTATLSLKIGSETRLVSLPEISALHAEGNFTRVFFPQDDPVFVSSPIGHYWESLPTPPFLHLSRSLIVNLNHVAKWNRLSKNRGQLWLVGSETPLDLGRVAMERLRGTNKR